MSLLVEESKIHAKLCKLKEADFRTLIVNFFSEQGGHAVDTHGSDERGLDIEVTIENVIPRPMVAFIQVKTGDVGLRQWRDILRAQLFNLIYRRPIGNDISEITPRRILFMTTGTLTNQVHEEIKDWNDRMPIPFESFDGYQFAQMLNQKGYTAQDITRNHLLKSTTVSL